MSEQVGGGFEREVRDTVVKSGLTGVAATVLAVTIFSPAGFGGMIGTSLASSFGNDASAALAAWAQALDEASHAQATIDGVAVHAIQRPDVKAALRPAG